MHEPDENEEGQSTDYEEAADEMESTARRLQRERDRHEEDTSDVRQTWESRQQEGDAPGAQDAEHKVATDVDYAREVDEREEDEEESEGEEEQEGEDSEEQGGTDEES
jgi:hypothetical protein